MHYCDVIMNAIASQITSVSIVYSSVCSDTDQRWHQSSASLAFVRGIHRGPVNSPHKRPVTRKMFPFDDVIMVYFSFMMSLLLLLIITLQQWELMELSVVPAFLLSIILNEYYESLDSDNLSAKLSKLHKALGKKAYLLEGCWVKIFSTNRQKNCV